MFCKGKKMDNIKFKLIQFKLIEKVNVFAVVPGQGRKKIFSRLPASAIALENWRKENPELLDWEIQVVSVRFI